jgi:hypothetical protein
VRSRTVARFRRTAVVLGAAALLAVSVPTAIPSDAADFANGNSFASAVVAKVTPGIGSLGLSTTAGVAVSEIKDRLAQAQGQTADLGLVGTSLTAEGCDGSAGALTPNQLPQPTRVDNRKGDAEASSDEIPLAGSQLGGGHEHARATKQPLAMADATATALAADPLIRLGAGQATATTRIVDGNAREAISSVDVNLDLAGVIQLRGLRWDAFHRTGAKPDVHGAFSIDGASAGGVALPVSSDQLAPVQDAINSALATTGLRVELPVVTHIEKPADLIRVSPLRIIIENSPLGATLFRPPLELLRPQKEDLFKQIGESYCQLASELLVGDISLSILAGAGFLAVDIGGVEATTAEVIYTDPFGSDAPLPNLNLPGVPQVLPETFTLPSEAGSAIGPSPRPVVAAGPTEKVCESTHPFHWPPCSRGAALPLGVLGVLATAGVALLDWRHQRRRTAIAEVTK